MTIPLSVQFIRGWALCKLDSNGTLNPHVHFYEEAFFILEGQVLERIDRHDYQLGPGDYGIIQAGVPHAFCHGEFSKSAMTRHLETCQQRIMAEAKAESRQKAQKTRKNHIVVEGRDLQMYWMHLEITASTTLATLDQFLRDTWLECCGHLSAFEIGGVRYAIDAGMDDEWDMGEKSMRVRLDKVLSPGQTCSYEYDYGTTTELKLKVISEREVEAKCVGNLLLRYVPSESMMTRGGYAMTAQRTTSVVKRCCCHE